MENDKDKMLEIRREMSEVITDRRLILKAESQITQTFVFSLYVFFTDRLCGVCGSAAFLLLGCVYMDVSGRRTAVHHAGGSVRERVLAHQVLLSQWIRSACCYSGCVCRCGLSQLWNRKSVCIWQIQLVI